MLGRCTDIIVVWFFGIGWRLLRFERIPIQEFAFLQEKRLIELHGNCDLLGRMTGVRDPNI
jgi:hypothetical protein